ncbi:radical SAM protein [Candidatus Woesearchaeota archaeon]|nr:radical SAM protein [Candidatus Woesearchaeota archaeon]
MTNILLLYPPFCTPASPPYSITYLAAFLKNNFPKNNVAELSKPFTVDVLDLNILFHRLKFKEYHNYYRKAIYDDYEEKTKQFLAATSDCYTENNKKVVNNQDPELLQKLMDAIRQKSPDIVALSIVYSSQAFYAVALLAELKKLGIKTIIGGPAINEKLKSIADLSFSNEVDFLQYLSSGKIKHEQLNITRALDFSMYNLNDYFTPAAVIPLRTSNSCFYKQCTFCTHHGNVQYIEHPLEDIKKTIIQSKQKYFFFIDDMIPKKRLLQLAEILKPLNILWMCQLRPTKDLDKQTLAILKESGLNIIIWGVESANDRILQLMKKGTNKKDLTEVLKNAKAAGIINALYIMFGFPTETKEEFLETIDFLKENTNNVDLISTSIFGLQKDAIIFSKPDKYGIAQIQTKQRTILEPAITYSVSSGLSQEEATQLRQKYKKTLDKINKYPKQMNFFREHMLINIIM